jgi:voltage-gated potassium channel Kch
MAEVADHDASTLRSWGLTIGYGDLTPHHVVAAALPAIGFAGIVLTGLVAAVIVRALQETARNGTEKP